MAGTSDWFFLLGNFSFLLVSKRTASNGRLLLRWTMSFPAFVVTVEAKQPPRRVLASRRLLFLSVCVPRFDPGPARKRGPGSKRGGRAPVGRCSLGHVWRDRVALLWFVLLPTPWRG